MDAYRRGHLIYLYGITSAYDPPPEKSNGQEMWKKIREAIFVILSAALITQRLLRYQNSL